MKYYILKQKDWSEIESGGKQIPFEYSQNVEALVEGKLKGSHPIFIGTMERAFYSSHPVVSEEFKTLLTQEAIEGIQFIEFEAHKGDLEDEDFESDEKLKCFYIKFDRLSNCINLEKSKLLMIQGKIRSTEKLVLKDKNLTAFCMLEEYQSTIFVNEYMKTKLEKSGLKGIKCIDTDTFTR